MAKVIDGNRIAQDVRAEVRAQALELKEKTGIVPGLAVILVGEDAASKIYVGRKEKAATEAGFLSREYRLPADTAQDRLREIVAGLNASPEIHGILVQLPLPKHINPDVVIETIDPRKDVDGFHPFNIGGLFTGRPGHRACTPLGIIELLDRSGIAIEGKEAVIVGRSNIVGKPLALMLLNRHATVTICHTRTRDLGAVDEAGRHPGGRGGQGRDDPGEMVREGAVVIDVGINRRPDGKLVGDVAYAEAAAKASFIT
ncbi:MAG: bifunctional methylenetetrahydrofolate dehydrogenase/methenyltetrahydrofolate cyclohydrolase, partial [Desulfobacterales bacterium]|nr:bifunctional methylenetetrahydrofolate dehydrogenase/methenyltetrahydrofolate cyclohydrolase [Desulfobacterales bacterium]